MYLEEYMWFMLFDYKRSKFNLVKPRFTRFIIQGCESNLDDMLIYDTTKEELSRIPQTVVARLEKYKMTVNPDKVKIHMNKVEYVSHVIDKYGI